MSRSSASLAAEVFPDVKVVKELGEHETMLSIDKARRLLGYAPEHSWRNYHPLPHHPHRRLTRTRGAPCNTAPWATAAPSSPTTRWAP